LAKKSPPAIASADVAMDFEGALKELESLVARMEQGDLPLEESLACFERGIALTRRCQQSLKNAEQKIQVLVEKEGRAELQPFAQPDDNAN
jgi:exodeoxyribonuclease VII small subunit